MDCMKTPTIYNTMARDTPVLASPDLESALVSDHSYMSLYSVFSLRSTSSIVPATSSPSARTSRAASNFRVKCRGPLDCCCPYRARFTPLLTLRRGEEMLGPGLVCAATLALRLGGIIVASGSEGSSSCTSSSVSSSSMASSPWNHTSLQSGHRFLHAPFDRRCLSKHFRPRTCPHSFFDPCHSATMSMLTANS